LRLILMLIVSALFGALWIALPLFLKLRFGISEIVLSLLLSNIAYLYLQHLLFGAWRDPAFSFPVSITFDPAEQLSQLGLGNLHSGLWIAFAIVAIMAIVIDRTRLGFYATAIGLNPMTARATGLPVTRTIVIVVSLSGALAGLAGGVIVAGTEHRLTQFIGAHSTFSGIVIACLDLGEVGNRNARNRAGHDPLEPFGRDVSVDLRDAEAATECPGGGTQLCKRRGDEDCRLLGRRDLPDLLD